jgi:hypothetical protein
MALFAPWAEIAEAAREFCPNLAHGLLDERCPWRSRRFKLDGFVNFIGTKRTWQQRHTFRFRTTEALQILIFRAALLRGI